MIKKEINARKLSILFLLAMLGSLATLIFGSPLIRVIRKTIGAKFFWIFFVCFLAFGWITKSYLLIIFVGGLWFMIGLSCEMEKYKVPISTNIIISIVTVTALSLLGVYWVLLQQGISDWNRLLEFSKEALMPFFKMNPNIQLDAKLAKPGDVIVNIGSLVELVPSLMAMMFLTSLSLSWIFERKIYHWMQLPNVKSEYRLNFYEVKAGDKFFWLTLITLFFNVLKLENYGFGLINTVASNFINVFAVFYFFQGASVLEVFFNKLRVNTLMRVFCYFVIVVQLIFLLVFVGFIDYWLDFRKKILKIDL